MDGPRDTSAAAVAALGMLHLAEAEAMAAAAAAAIGAASISGSAAPDAQVDAQPTPVESSSSSSASSSSVSTCGSRYLCAAINTLRALGSDKYLSQPGEAGFPALLRHATGGFPLRNHVDVGLISGDYFYLAALAKCAKMPVCASAVW